MTPGRAASKTAAEKAAEVERELSEFSYIVSHDLAASCRHLSQFSQLLVRDMGGALSDPQRSYAGHIQAAGEKCQAMMEQLLIFSRIQQRELRSDLHDATRLAEAALLQLSREVHQADAEVSIDPLGTVFGDAELLTLAFRQLLDNAIKFRLPGGTCRVQVFAADKPGFWTARIVDHGIGLAGDHFEKAFRMFWQLHANGEHTGVGAGLAICRRIARRHGGEVRFVEWKDGTCVELTLPSVYSVH